MKTNSRVLRPLIPCFFVLAGTLALVGTMAGSARGECVPAREPPASASGVTAANRELATNRFLAGNVLLEKQDYEGALDLFLRSRAIWYHWANTLNAAVCLAHLGRHHEALAMYEDVLRDFPNDIGADERERITGTIAKLEKLVFRIRMAETSGTLTVDTESCGTLPRAESIYLLPGVHLFRVRHAGNPERSVRVEGHAGAMRTLHLPPLPPKPSVSPPLPVKGQWFVQAAGGPAIGSVGDAFPGMSSINGFLVEMRDGYRFPNQITVGLNMGVVYASAAETPQTHSDPANNFTTFYLERYTLAQYGNVMFGWDPYVDRRFASLFRVGVGLLGGQSKNVLDAAATGRRMSIDALNFETEGREIVYSVTPFARFELGLVWQVKQIRVGFSAGAMILLQDGPNLADVNTFDPNSAFPIKVHFEHSLAYQFGFLLLPQIVVEYDP